MRKSSVRGAHISDDIEVLGLTPHALWIMIGEREYMLELRHRSARTVPTPIGITTPRLLAQ